MLGAVTGDIIGSRFEWNNIKHKRFALFSPACRFTDDSVMTLAIAKAVLESGEDISRLGASAVRCMQELGRQYPNCGYGGMFRRWVWSWQSIWRAPAVRWRTSVRLSTGDTTT